MLPPGSAPAPTGRTPARSLGASGGPGGRPREAAPGGAWAPLLGAGSGARGAHGLSRRPVPGVSWAAAGARRAPTGVGTGRGSRVPVNLGSAPPGPGSSSSRRGARARRCPRAPRLRPRPPPARPARAPPAPPPRSARRATTDAFASCYSSRRRRRRRSRSPPAPSGAPLPGRWAAAAGLSVCLSVSQVSYLLKIWAEGGAPPALLAVSGKVAQAVPTGPPSPLPLFLPGTVISPHPVPDARRTPRGSGRSSSPAHLKNNSDTHSQKRLCNYGATRDARAAARQPGSLLVSNFARRLPRLPARRSPVLLGSRAAARRAASQPRSRAPLPPRRGLGQLWVGREGGYFIRFYFRGSKEVKERGLQFAVIKRRIRKMGWLPLAFPTVAAGVVVVEGTAA